MGVLVGLENQGENKSRGDIYLFFFLHYFKVLSIISIYRIKPKAVEARWKGNSANGKG